MQLTLPLLANEPEYHTVWVRHRRARRYIVRVLDDGTLRVTVPWRGSKREAIAFVEKCADWIASRRSAVAPASLRRDRLSESQAQELRDRARDELPRELSTLAQRHGVAVTRVSIRNQRSRWGACSARGSITLNWRLILVPAFVREYVMIHELMHRRELNHSRRFWEHVRAACPRYREARQWLLTEGQSLFSS